jgi:hypothetical protein
MANKNCRGDQDYIVSQLVSLLGPYLQAKLRAPPNPLKRYSCNPVKHLQFFAAKQRFFD